MASCAITALSDGPTSPHHTHQRLLAPPRAVCRPRSPHLPTVRVISRPPAPYPGRAFAHHGAW
ncbi:hypothetical protein DENSPDRAFT_839993 [Dentipellis sp. KUC8613]|nr:hypothetical protein DENSPDRAFT_839993 [Dentipellis sp. KUC8613]